MSAHPTKVDSLVFNALANEMISKSDMFGARMVSVVVGHCNCTLIVGIERSRMLKGTNDFGDEVTNPNELLCNKWIRWRYYSLG